MIKKIKKEKEKLEIKTKKVFLLTTILFLGSIPVGIAVARQRVGDAGLFAALSQKDNNQRLHDLGKFYRTIRIYEPYTITHTCYFLLPVNKSFYDERFVCRPFASSVSVR